MIPQVFFPEVQNNFGFGCMRLPMKNGSVDTAVFSKMIERFFEAGFTYFDTAHGYLGGRSETAIRECLTSKYPRDSYTLTNKLTTSYFNKESDIRPLFESQLKACGVDYFDFYLMHAQSAELYEKFQKCRAYETAMELKAEGKIRHFGISFHDTADVLERILTEHPEIELVQIQFNYADYEDPAVQSRACYEVCRKYGKPVVVMEPVKGGSLIDLPPQAQDILDGLHGGSNASYAIRFAASFEGVMMVLSGMSDMEQMEDNIGFMKHFQPLSETEFQAVAMVREAFRAQNLVPCTACRYCSDGCPKNISIPDLFSCLNTQKKFGGWNAGYYYKNVYTVNNGKASECVKCGKCEAICPQHLPIRELLQKVAAEFEQ
ncbi:aldo/keto reductase [Eisenbergiella sp.]